MRTPPYCLPFDLCMERLLAEYRAGSPVVRRCLNRVMRARLAELQAAYVAEHGRDASGDYRSLSGAVRYHARTGQLWVTVYEPGEAVQCVDCGWIGVVSSRWDNTPEGWRCDRCQRPSVWRGPEVRRRLIEEVSRGRGVT